MEIDCENYYEVPEKLETALEHKEKEIILYNIHWAVIREVLDNLGFKTGEIDTNGWQHDVWIQVWIPNTDYYYDVSCSWYYPETVFKLVTDSEKVKELDEMYNI